MKVNAVNNKVLSRSIFHEGLRFLIAGITTTAVCWGSLVAFVELLNLHYLISANLATLCAWVYAYFVNRFFVFRNHKQKHIGQVVKFIVLQALLLGWTNLVLYLLVGRFGIHYLIIVIGNAVLLVVVNFLCQKIFVFTTVR